MTREDALPGLEDVFAETVPPAEPSPRVRARTCREHEPAEISREATSLPFPIEVDGRAYAIEPQAYRVLVWCAACGALGRRFRRLEEDGDWHSGAVSWTLPNRARRDR